jgi:DNA-binding transcriptional MocR family regulator
MRIGLIVMPTDMIKILEQYRAVSYYYSYFSASLISQATLEIYIRSNILKKHVNHVTKELQEKQKRLSSNFQRLEGLGVKCIGGKSGFYSYLQLQDYIDENKLVEDLKSEGLLVSLGNRFFLDESFYKKGIRLSIASVSNEEIDKGFQIITDKLQKYIR